MVVTTVREELQQGYNAGYEFLGDALDLIVSDKPDDEYDIRDNTVIHLKRIHSSREKIDSNLDPGEADSLYHALINGRVLATDDRDARQLARELDVPVTGSLGILVRGIKQDKITVSTANEWLSEWQDAGYHSPVDDMRELSDKYTE
ncbi:hypothetical protein [Halalkalicoccus jeotgali]|nr:hypothetical protein [Halalkalicoccus jeotgali]